MAATTVVAQQKTESYTIVGNMEGATGKVYLTISDKRNPAIIDSTTAHNGKFQFTGSIDLPIMVQIDDDNMKTIVPPFFLDNNRILVYGSTHNPRNVNVYGSITNGKFLEYKNQIDHIIRHNSGSGQRIDLLPEINQITINFIENNTDCVVSAYLLSSELSNSMPPYILMQKINTLSHDVQKSIYIKKLREQVDAIRATRIGERFTEISLPSVTGEIVKLSAVVESGKYVLIEFWASWFGPCDLENSQLKAIYDRFAPKGFEIYAVSLDKRRDQWIREISTSRMPWIHVSNLSMWNCPAVKRYAIKAIPSNILISPDGTIIARDIRGAALVQRLTNLLEPKQESQRILNSMP